MTVDVVIPVYNGEKLVADAVRSVLEQDLLPTTIIVVDDGSTDGTQAALEPFRDAIRVVAHETNQGLPAARNTGIDHSKADLVAFLDADDVWLPPKLRRQTAVFKARPDVGLCYTSLVDCDMSLVPMRPPRRFRARDGEWVFDELYLQAFPIPPSTVVVRRGVLAECGLFDATMLKAQDYECWLRVAMRYRISCLSDALCLRRDNPGSITQRAGLEKDVFYAMRAFDLCAEAAERWRISLPMPVADRKRLFLRRRCMEYADAGMSGQASFFAACLQESGGCSSGDRAAVWLRLLRARTLATARMVVGRGRSHQRS